MKFLLDTCIVSDSARKGYYPQLESWLAAQIIDDLAISVVTIGELRYGIQRLPTGRKRNELLTWLETQLQQNFLGRILDFDNRAAEAWGVLRAAGEATGRPLPMVDGQLLAVAQSNNLTFVTRNDKDVQDRGVSVVNPY